VGKKPFDKKVSDGNNLEEELLDEEKTSKKMQQETADKNDKDTLTQEEKCEEENKAEENKQKDTRSAEEESLNNKLVRLQADFLNYKNRTEKEKFSTYGNAVSDVIKDLLPVLDNLERALATDKSENNSFKDGIQMVYTQFASLLDKKGLKEIEALQKQFDHNLHYGVAFDCECEEEDGTIIEVLQKGYTMNDKVIRPAMVRIAKK
jgi:molecular chaperone GrpE